VWLTPHLRDPQPEGERERERESDRVTGRQHFSQIRCNTSKRLLTTFDSQLM